ncbi:MAG: tRNA adenosine(34) deaminase TadA [Gammaproteobacteria bacterium]|nr:tRNA adenosine(34) deaminase TadA [Gammaproteobacteria bacterium]MCW5583019.1 tRNA adenosine(34) deaminase TadA [Gammaproteobacteria bacterium]
MPHAFSSNDEHWMQRALALAHHAKQAGEVPVGALLVMNNEVLAEGYNCPISMHDPSAHAEIMVIRKAAEKIGNYRLLSTTLYVTLEPCIMCAGAMVHARINRLVYGAADLKAGAIISKMAVLEASFLNHHVEYTGGLLAEQCGAILSDFFRERR